MAHHNKLSSASRTTCPQELIELILGETDPADKLATLKSCALVARSFRPTSQQLIFSDLTIVPAGRDSILALQRLADVLSAAPHLALHVRALYLVQPSLNKPCVWMQSDILSATNARLLALLRCFPPSLKSASLDVSANHSPKLTGASVGLHQLRLASLHLNTPDPALSIGRFALLTPNVSDI
ncbi:hypothetical protein C8F04DRAFT_729792 [Mycena alexandri]|uniref:F-box domain-containing protein n=1 Tax=Mycena alexandri TaxID=1745969 RepID=A0AAD6WWX8_9AGAR|nr:hypothetical protein C8F04DRAFT_729792 [Mycena alexandri]